MNPVQQGSQALGSASLKISGMYYTLIKNQRVPVMLNSYLSVKLHSNIWNNFSKSQVQNTRKWSERVSAFWISTPEFTCINAQPVCLVVL